MLIAFRTDFADIPLDMGIIGREVLRFDGSDPRFTGELLHGPSTPAATRSAAITGPTSTPRSGRATSSWPCCRRRADLTAEEQSATSGYVKTIQALNYLMISTPTRRTRFRSSPTRQ